MESLVRFSVSVPGDLSRSFDRLLRSRRYSNRSEFIRDLLRAELVRGAWEAGAGTGMAVLSLVYDHHTRNLTQKLNEIQHRKHASVVAALHVHLDLHHCLEVIVLRGKPRDIRSVARQLIACRGVHRGELVPATSGADPHAHGHGHQHAHAHRHHHSHDQPAAEARAKPSRLSRRSGSRSAAGRPARRRSGRPGAGRGPAAGQRPAER